MADNACVAPLDTLLWEPTVASLLHIPQDTFQGRKLASLEYETLQPGAIVYCRWDKDEQYYEAFVRTILDDDSLEITWLDDGYEATSTADQCEATSTTLWQAGTWLVYHLWNDPELAEFHAALQQLTMEYPDIPSSLFTYWGGTTLDSNSEQVVDICLHPLVEPYAQERTTYTTIGQNVTAVVDNKYLFYEIYKQDPIAASVFPSTYGTIQQALDDTTDEIFFIKGSVGTQGQDIQIMTRTQLSHEEPYELGSVVIQPAITNILTLKQSGPLYGRRFDIRFFVLVHGGRLYMHSFMYAMWAGDQPFDPNNPDLDNHVNKRLQYESGKERQRLRDFLFFPEATGEWSSTKTSVCQNNKTQGLDPHAWREQILCSMQKARRTFDPLLASTDNSTYHWFGGDAIMTQDGRAVLIEFNAWPDFSFFNGGRENCLERDLCSRRIVLPQSNGAYTLTSPSMDFYSVTSGYTTRILRDTAALVMGLEELPERFVQVMEWEETCSNDTCEMVNDNGDSATEVRWKLPESVEYAMDQVDWPFAAALVIFYAILKFYDLGRKQSWQILSKLCFLASVVLYKWQFKPSSGLLSPTFPWETVTRSFHAFSSFHPNKSILVVLCHFGTYWTNVAAFRARTVQKMVFWWILYELVTSPMNEYCHFYDVGVLGARSVFVAGMKQYAVDDMIRAYILPPLFVYGYLVPRFGWHCISQLWIS